MSGGMRIINGAKYDLRRFRKGLRVFPKYGSVRATRSITIPLDDLNHAEFLLHALDRGMTPASLARSIVLGFNARARINGKEEK